MDVSNVSHHGSSSLWTLPDSCRAPWVLSHPQGWPLAGNRDHPRALSLLQTGNPSQHHVGSEQTGTFPAAGFSHLSWAALASLCSSAQYFWGKMDNMGVLKHFPTKPAQFHCSSRKISSAEAEQALAAGAGGAQWLQQDLFFLALSHLTAPESNLRALGKEQGSDLLPFLAGFEVKDPIPQCSLRKTYQAYFYSFLFPTFFFSPPFCNKLWIKLRARAWCLSGSGACTGWAEPVPVGGMHSQEELSSFFGLWEKPAGTPWSWWKLWLSFITPSKPGRRGVYHLQEDWAAQGHILLCMEQQSPTAVSHQGKKKFLPLQLFHYFFIILFFPNLHLLRYFCNTGAQHPNIPHWLKTSGLRGCHWIPQKGKKLVASADFWSWKRKEAPSPHGNQHFNQGNPG